MSATTNRKLSALWAEGREDHVKRQLGVTIIMLEEKDSLKDAKSKLDKWLGLK